MATQMQLKVLFGKIRMAARTLRKKKQQQSRVFFRRYLRERARASD